MTRPGTRFRITVYQLLSMGLVLMMMNRPGAGHDRPTGALHKGRSAVLARNGMAATSHPLAAQTALQVLKEGGNAIDAAVAANAVIGLVEPMSCGIGGDLFAIVWHAESGKLYGLNASGRVSERATIEHYQSLGYNQIPIYGPLSWSIPGCVDGWQVLLDRFGTRPLADLLAPAIEYAERGFPVSEIIAASWQGSAGTLSQVPSSAATFLPNGIAPKYGDLFRNPDLAKTYRRLAEKGAKDLYQGSIAQEIVAYSNEVGGLFTEADLARHTSTWVEPVSTQYRGYDIWELPPNGQGIAALQMLNLLERFDLRSFSHNSPEVLHLMIEAKKLAFEDRAAYYADPEFSKVPINTLISKSYADHRAKQIDPAHASLNPEAGRIPESDTIYLTVVDKDYNAVSLIQSIFHGFGSQHVPGRLGFALQNRGALFALDEQHANRLEPRKRPFHTIIPAFVTHEGKPWLSFGVMGGDMQPQGHVQLIVNMVDFGMDVQEAGEAARFRHFGSSEPTGQPAQGGGTVLVESGISENVRRALVDKGHRVLLADPGGDFGGYQGIRIDVDRGVLMGGSDPRKDGSAVGY